MHNIDLKIDNIKYDCVPALPNQPELQIFSQRDIRWKNHIMGGTNQTIGQAGCAMCCAAMVASVVKTDITPAWLNAQNPYHIVNGTEAHLAWERLPSIIPKTEWVPEDKLTWKRLLTTDELTMVILKLEIAPLILYVDFYPGGAFDSHFVLGLKYLPDEEDIEIADPWDGVKTKLLQRYARLGQGLKIAIWGIRGYYSF